jgi:pantoate--beta-alanine ligase
MEVIRNVARMRHLSHRIRVERKQIGLIPTWGGLHEGHLALVRKVQDLVDTTVLAILTNPAESEVEGRDPNPSIVLTHDVELLIPTDLDFVFAPNMKEFRSPEASTEVIVRGLSERFLGTVRPRFYAEASTLMVTLLNIIDPHIVCLGQKDPQFVAITNQLVEDLQFSCQILLAPVVREPDGAAASWWLQRMTPAQRQAAGLVYKALEKIHVLFGAGERNAHNLIEAIRDFLKPELLIQLEYVGIVDTHSLEPVSSIDDAPAMAAIAVTIGEAHLIDNIILNE